MSFKEKFGGATYHDPNMDNRQSAPIPQLSTKEDRESCHQMIDLALASNPEMAKRAHLMTDIAADLEPWIMEGELDHVMSSFRYVSSEKLEQMNNLLHNKETTYKQKALIKKSLLTHGYIRHFSKKLRQQLIIQPLCLLATIGALAYGIPGMFKKDDRAVLTSGGILAIAYLVSSSTNKKFGQETKDAREFLHILTNDDHEKKRVDAECQKWFTTNKFKTKE